MAKKNENLYVPGQHEQIPLSTYNVVVVFDDGSEEIVPVQGRGPLGAIYTAAMSRRTDWPTEKQSRVVALRLP